MIEIPIIDTHLHLCNKSRFTYSWLNDSPKLDRSFLPDDYSEATGSLNVVGMVFMEYVIDTWEQAIEEAQWVYDLSNEEPRIKGIIARAPLHLGDGSRAYLERLRSNPLVKGVRQILQFEEGLDFCLKPEFVLGTRILSEFGFFFHICISYEHFPYVIQLVDQCPDVRFVLDHIGKPNIKDGVLEPWKTHLRTLSEFPNVVCKISGLITEADNEDWTKEDLKPYIDHSIDSFGFDRVIYGGDWPVCTLAGQYTDWTDALEWALGAVSDEEKTKLLHDNAVGLYQL